MYATFEEANVGGHAAVPQHPEPAPTAAHHSVSEDTGGSVGHEPQQEDQSSSVPPVEPSHVIGALRMFVLNNAHAPPPLWRRYRHELPTTVADLQLHPSPIEQPQRIPTNTFAIQLDKEPENSVSEYCNEVIDYVMSHFVHLSAQSPILSLRFSKVGSIVSQCVVTVGNNDVGLARQLVENLNEVGFPTNFVASKPPPPCATMIVWDVKRSIHGGRGVQVEDIEMLLAPQGPNNRPVVGGVSVVKGFEEGIFYAAMKRPDVVFAWLMNTASSWLFQRELYSKLGVLLLMAPCEHQWAQRRGQHGGVEDQALAQQVQRQGRENLSSDDEEEEELLTSTSHNIDIFSFSAKNQGTLEEDTRRRISADAVGQIVPTPSAMTGSADWAHNNNSDHRLPQYSAEFPEIVGDDDDEAEDDGLLAAPDLAAGFPSYQAVFGELMPPPPSFPPGRGEVPFHPGMGFPPYFSGLDGAGLHQHHILHPPPRAGEAPPVLSDFGPTFTSAPFYAPHRNNGAVSSMLNAPSIELSPIPDILMPEETTMNVMSEGDAIENCVEALERTEPSRVPMFLSDQKNFRRLNELVSNAGSVELSSATQPLVEKVVACFLRELPPPKTPRLPYGRFHSKPTVLDACLHDRLIGMFPLYGKLARVSPTFLGALAQRLVANLHRLPFRSLLLAVLDADPTPSNVLVAEFVRNPVQWCVDAADVTRGNLFQFPHLMVPYGTNGFRVMFECSSLEQQAAFRTAIRSLSGNDLRHVVEQAELMGRAMIVSALCSGLLDDSWVLERINRVPEDNKLVGWLVDFACVVVHGRRETLLSDSMITIGGQFCAMVDAAPLSPPTFTDEHKLDFLHQAILRRFFAPAQEKFHVLRDAFFAKMNEIGGRKDGTIASVLDTSSWPRRPAPPGAKGPSSKPQREAVAVLGAGPRVQQGLLPLPPPSAPVLPQQVAEALPVLPTENAFCWNEQWTTAFSSYPLSGEPFPDPVASTENGEPQRWKWSVSKSYGHYYFRNEEKHSKPTYKHPTTSQTYMVSPQSFLALEASEETSRAIQAHAAVSTEVFEEWKSDQRNRNKSIDEAVLSLLKITYREHSSGSNNKNHGDDNHASRILKAQRDLERKLRFVQDLQYPTRGHPFPPLGRGWTCSLSASNGLYYFKRQATVGHHHHQEHAASSYEHPDTKREYAPTPQAYAFFEGIKEQKLLDKLSPYGVTKERIQTWVKDQTVRDADIDYYVVEKIGVRYDRGAAKAKRARSESR